MRPEFKRQTITATIVTVIFTFLFVRYSPMPKWLAYLTSINIVCFSFYGWDKWRAVRQKSRTPEVALHVLALAGGVLGAWLGQKTFRHKTIKRSFQWIFWSIAFLQILAIIAWVCFKY